MKMNSDRWLLQRVDDDECEITSVGGLPHSVAANDADTHVDWNLFPVKEMLKRGWLSVEQSAIDELGAVSDFFCGVPDWQKLSPLYRKTQIRSGKQIDPYSLAAWTARIVLDARRISPPCAFEHEALDLSAMREIAKLSVSESWPTQVRDRLLSFGVVLVVEPHLPGTYLDGAAIVVRNNFAVIGLTVRYDRIDNFWFCLMHELAHLALHVGIQSEAHFFDDFDDEGGDLADPREREADELAGEALIPREAWASSPASLLPSKEAAMHLARELGVHPAIVAGRIRHERHYAFLSQLVGQDEVRNRFPEVRWSL